MSALHANFNWNAHHPFGLVSVLSGFLEQLEKYTADLNKEAAKSPTDQAYWLSWHGTDLIRAGIYAAEARKLLGARGESDYWSETPKNLWSVTYDTAPEEVKSWMRLVCATAEREMQVRYISQSSNDASNLADLAKASFYANLYDAMSLELKVAIAEARLKRQQEEIAKAEAKREADRLAAEKAAAEAEEAKKARRKARREARRLESIYPAGTR